MLEIIHHDHREFRRWIHGISKPTQARIADRLILLGVSGHHVRMPTVRRLGDGLSELRIDKYRLYFTIHQNSIRMLAYGEKDTQRRDINRARGRK